MKNSTIQQLKQISPTTLWQNKTLKKLKEAEKLIKTTASSDTATKFNLSFIKNIMNNKKFFLFVLVALTVLTGTFLVSNLISSKKNVKQASYLSEQEKTTILSNILNSPQSYSFSQNKGTNLSAIQADASLETSTYNKLAGSLNTMLFPLVTDKLIINRSIIKTGNAICKEGFFDYQLFGEKEVTTENYSYYDGLTEGNQSVSYFATLNENGHIISANMYKENTENYESIDYRGGKYAAETITPKTVNNTGYGFAEPAGDLRSESSPEETVVFDQKIKEIFGEDAVYYQTVDRNGNTAFVIESAYRMYCDTQPESTDTVAPQKAPDFWNGEDWEDTYITSSKMLTEYGDTNIINLTYFNPETFKTYLYETYRESVSENNLIIYTETLEETTEERSFDDAKSFITSKLNGIEIRNFEPQLPVTLETSSDSYLTIFKNKSIFPLVSLVENPEYQSLYVYDDSVSNRLMYSAEMQPKYLSDREFYREGPLGEKEYSDFVNSQSFEPDTIDDYITSMAGYSVSLTSGESIAIDIFNNNVDDISIINYKIYAPVKDNQKSQEDITLDIEGVTLPARLYTYTFEEIMYGYDEGSGSSSSSAEAPVESKQQTVEKTAYLLIFDYKGYKYVFSESIPAYFDEQTLNGVNSQEKLFDLAKFNSWKLKFLDPNNLADSQEIKKILETVLNPEIYQTKPVSNF